MAKRLIEYDAETRTEVWHEYDSINKTTTIAEIQDCEPILERNKAFRNHGKTAKGLNEVARRGIKNDWMYVASIPNHIILKWKQEHGVDIFNKHQTKEMLKLLQRPEYSYLRTGTGRLV